MEKSLFKYIVPQKGRARGSESLSDAQSGCPTDSGGGKNAIGQAGNHSTRGNIVTMDITHERQEEGKRPALGLHSRLNVESQLKRCSSLSIGSHKKRKMDAMDAESTDATRKVEDPTAFVIMEAIGMIKKQAQDLEKRIRENPNTKKEIKEIATKLSRNVEIFNRISTAEWFELHKWKPVEIPKYDVDVQTDEGKKEQTGIDIAIQVDLNDMESEKARHKARIIREIRTVVEKGGTFNELATVLDEKWPNEAYKKTKKENGNPTKIDNKRDLAIIMDPTNKAEKGIIKHILEKDIELQGLVDGAIQEGHIEYLETATKTNSSRGETKKEVKYKYILPHVIDKAGINNMEIVYGTIQNFKQLITQQHRRELDVVIQDGLNREYIRKIMEQVLHETDVEIKIWMPKGPEAGKKGVGERKDQIEEVIIRSGDKTYAELVRTVKEKVDLDKTGVEIRSMRQIGGGGLAVRVKQGTLAGALRGEIEANVRDVSVKLRKDEKILHITDIDPTITEDNIKDAIRDEMGLTGNYKVEVRALRPNRDGNQTATVSIQKDAARKLLQKGAVKIGWVRCRVRERVNVLRCYKCLDFGHRKAECTKTVDCTDECLNCGTLGHKARECQNVTHCRSCKVKGHRADTTKWPIFRRMIKDISKGHKPSGRKY